MSRRELLVGGAATAAALSLPMRAEGVEATPLEEVRYEQVAVRGARQAAQRENVLEITMGLNEDSLLKPFREMCGAAGPGVSLGGWYEWRPEYDYHHDDAGLAPGATFGQWMSALARFEAASRFEGGAGAGRMGARVERLNGLLGATLTSSYFAKTRFAGYSYDKLVCGLMDAQRLLGDGAALGTLDRVTAAAVPVLPGRVVDREYQWKMGADGSWLWDETYTMPENLYLVSTMGAGPQYRQMAEAYLDDASYFEPLSRGLDALADKHAYSYVNALCSAMQAYLVGGSAMHLTAAKNGFDLLERQSFATGGWGPDEMLRKPGYDQVFKSLTLSHNGFETPCGSYAHMKLTRYLLRVTRDGRYGDSMERVMQNTVMGALPLEADGRSFYSSDYNVVGKRIYSLHRWPCCSGTLPQVVADYGINSYLREPGAVWVVLYQPSELRWTEGGRSFAIEQMGTYPEVGTVRLRVTASAPARFALRLRIPAWAGDGARLRVNGRVEAVVARKGFATVERVWRTGDAVELELPMTLRMEAMPASGGIEHPETMALLRGPVVLFAIREAGESGPLSVSREALLGAEQTGPREWRLKGGERRLVPFPDVGERSYSTYVTVT